MDELPDQVINRLLSPKSRFSYALWILLLFNGIAGSRRGRYDSDYFWLYGAQAVFFGIVWIIATLSRLREFGWNLWLILPYTLTWFGLIWIFFWDPGRIALAILAVWFIAQSFLVLKNGRSTTGPKEAEEKA
jgi:hypothetical protein